MLYLVYGEQSLILKKKIKTLTNEILPSELQDEFNVITISCRETLLQDVILEAISYPFSGTRKVIILRDCYFFASPKEKCSIDKDQDYDKFIKFLENDIKNSDLIFAFEGENLDTKNQIYSTIKKKGKIIHLETLDESSLRGMGNELFQKNHCSITQDALDELVSRCGNDVSRFVNEGKKLCLFTKKITRDDVVKLVSLPLEDNAFLLLNALIENQPSLALRIFKDLMVKKEEPVRLISLIASQIRFLNQVTYLHSQNMSYNEIASELKANPYRVKRNIKTSLGFSRKQITFVLDSLYDLDLNIKSGKIDPALGLELFIINFEEIKLGHKKTTIR